MVMLNHGIVHVDMLINNFQWPEPMDYLGAGYLSVIVFFCISGYVIGLTNDRSDLNVKLYIKKRLVRLYPVYIAALLLCIIIAGWTSTYIIAGNFLFLQNNSPYGSFNIPIFVNYVTWSLNNEVVYYLLFIPVFFIKPKVWQLTLCMVVLGVLLVKCSPGIVFMANYINGFYFWLLGLFIGWKIIDGKHHNNAIPLLSMLFLHLCLNYLDIGAMIVKICNIHSNYKFDSLFFLPFCLMVMSILTQKDNVFFRVNKIICYLTPAILFAYLALHHRLFENERWIMCLIFWILSLILYSEKRFSAIILDKLTYIGKISYALYLFHVPIAELIKKTVFISDKTTEIMVKYTLWIAITFSLAILFDIIIQPKIKKLFFRS